MKFVDVSHTVHDGMVTYKGLPPPVISDHLSRVDSRQRYAPGIEFQIGRIDMVANTGTYIDSPFHRYEDGADLSGLELSSVANLEGVVLRFRDENRRGIEAADFQELDLAGRALLIDTGWDKHWRTDEYSTGNHPYVTENAAKFLSDSGVVLVGIDSFNIDATSGGERPAHSLLLAKGIPIVEHLCHLDDLPDRDFRFFSVPVKVSRFGSFPVRAFAIVSD